MVFVCKGSFLSAIMQKYFGICNTCLKIAYLITLFTLAIFILRLFPLLAASVWPFNHLILVISQL